ncbi:MAG: fatty acid desaturase [Firmicutes bacterium]|nr:fatty acid desaturase [Bacillota bacterium]
MTKQEATSGWKADVAPYEKASTRRSIGQLLNTILPFLALWIVAYLSLSISYWLALPIDVIAALFLVRIFILFHDCTHHSFFKNRLANEITGIVTGFLASFPYEQWKHEHAIHHATSSNLSRRGTGDIWTLTIDEYVVLPLVSRITYRVYRNPFVMFGIGPVYMLLVAYRYNRKSAGRKERLNTHLTSAALIVFFGALAWLLGWRQMLMVEGPILYLSAMVGIWLFYVQHQFEDTYFEHAAQWSYVRAALEGSSYYQLPRILQWMVGNIGYHHIHHLSPRVPNYSLRQVHEGSPAMQQATAIGWRTSLKSLKYRLWDEKNKRFVGFSHGAVLQKKRRLQRVRIPGSA